MLKGKILLTFLGALTAMMPVGSSIVSAQTKQTPSSQQEQQRKAKEQQRIKQQEVQRKKAIEPKKSTRPKVKPPMQEGKPLKKPTPSDTKPITKTSSDRTRPPPPGASPEMKKKNLDTERSLYLRRLKSSQVRAEREGNVKGAKELEQKIKQYEKKWGIKAPASDKPINTPKIKQQTPSMGAFPPRSQATTSEVIKLQKEKEKKAQVYRDQWSKLTNEKIQAEIAGDSKKAKALTEKRKQLEKQWGKESRTYQQKIDAAQGKPSTTSSDAPTRTGQGAIPQAKPDFKPGAAKPPKGMYLTPEQAKIKAAKIEQEYSGSPHYIYNNGKIVDVVPKPQEKIKQKDGTYKYVVPDGHEMVTDMNTGKVFYKKKTGPEPPSQISISPGSPSASAKKTEKQKAIDAWYEERNALLKKQIKELDYAGDNWELKEKINQKYDPQIKALELRAPEGIPKSALRFQ
jgi:hypothetical protein